VAVVSDDEGTRETTVGDPIDLGTTTDGISSTTPNEDTTSESSEGSSSTTVSSFIEDPDGGTRSECDIFAQDCLPGFKCSLWANDGGSAWNATRCVPIAEDPGEPGEPCVTQESVASGLDDCRIGAMCWNVDPKTLEGTCIAFCLGERSQPICEDPGTFCPISSDGLAVCLPLCDPLAQDCPKGEACYPFPDNWGCLADASGELGGYGDPCEFTNTCDPGLICLGAAATPDCVGSGGCCAEICDLSSAEGDAQCTGAAQGQTCQAWYEEGAAPHGYENVGACALPA